MSKQTARGQITIIDQNDVTPMNAFIGSNKPNNQVYTADGNKYNPDWSVAPYLVLTPQVYVAGKTADQAAAGVIKPGSAIWFKDGVRINDGGNYSISPTAPYALTVKANDTNGNNTIMYMVRFIVIDPATQQETQTQATISFSATANASSGYLASLWGKTGTIINNNPLNPVTAVTLVCDLFKGGDIMANNVSYQWLILDAVFKPTTTTAAANSGTKVLTVASVANMGVGGKLTVNGANYDIDSVDIAAKQVTLTTALSAQVASGAGVTNPYYNSAYGEGWAAITNDAYFGGITGYTSKELVVPASAVQGQEVFRCIAKDTANTSSSINYAASTIPVADMTDPVRMDIQAPQGVVMQAGVASLKLIASLNQNGVGIDTAGTLYNYTWNKYKGGVNMSDFSKSGREITVSKDEIAGNATFTCTAREK